MHFRRILVARQGIAVAEQELRDAVKAARDLGIRTLGLLGRTGGELREIVDEALVVPSDITARIQEIHQMVYHFWCEVIDACMDEV